MGFDLDRNFGIGFGAGVAAGIAASYAYGRVRQVLTTLREATAEEVSGSGQAARSADRRYMNALMKFCNANHLVGHQIDLTEILIEPRFINAPELVSEPDEDVVGSVFEVVPQIHDMPALHAPYNIPTMSMSQLGQGDRAVALLGQPGSGRTTALLAIAMWSAGRVRFEPDMDYVEQQLAEEEREMPSDQRRQRVQERRTMEERARERLLPDSSERQDAATGRTRRAPRPVFQQLEPVYIHLANVNITTREYGRNVDPAEPLVRALQYRSPYVVAKTLPRHIYRQLQKGQLLMLIDGYDDLSEAERAKKLTWLEALVDTYINNFIIVAGPATGFGGLTRIGLAPVFMRPWDDLDIERAVSLWSQNWSDIAGKRNATADDLIRERIRQESRGLLPFELSLRLWAELGTDPNEEQPGYESWLHHYLNQTLDNAEELMPVLARMAALQRDEGYITRDRLVALEMEERLGVQLMDKPQTSAAENIETDDTSAESSDDDEFEAFIEEVDDTEETETAESTETDDAEEPSLQIDQIEDKNIAKETRQVSREQAKLISNLEKSGLLVNYRGDHYQFRYGLIADYLASQTLTNMETLAERIDQPAWQQAIAYLSLHSPVDNLVNEFLTSQKDILHNNILMVTRWLFYTGGQAAWRNSLLKQLGNLLVAPDQFPLIRERIAAGLVSSQDRGALIVFRRALASPQPDIRRLACLGLGALRDVEALDDLVHLTDDEDTDVQLAAGLAVAALKTDEALQAMAEILTVGSERLRQAIAESFASIPEEGHPVLYDAVRDEDFMLRRAAVFGLRRVQRGWALAAIYQTSIEEKQWYVQSAAQQAFQDLKNHAGLTVQGYPGVEGVPWLLEWAAGLGDQLPEDADGRQLLLMALEQGDLGIRAQAALTVGQLGMADYTRNLYGALFDQDSIVRDAAYRALADLQLQMGKPLPAPL